MEPYYEDDTIQIVQFKGPTQLQDVQRALAAFLTVGTANRKVEHRRFLLELQRAKFNFGTDEASEFYLFAEQLLETGCPRQVVIIIDADEQAREPTARLLSKLSGQLQQRPHLAIAANLAEAHDLFESMDDTPATQTPAAG